MTLSSSESAPEPIRLHFFPGTRAARARWILEEIGVPYQLSVVDLRLGAHKRKDYLAVHPLGKVPALEIDNSIIFESLGIRLYLADRFRQAHMAPLRRREKAGRTTAPGWPSLRGRLSRPYWSKCERGRPAIDAFRPSAWDQPSRRLMMLLLTWSAILRGNHFCLAIE